MSLRHLQDQKQSALRDLFELEKSPPIAGVLSWIQQEQTAAGNAFVHAHKAFATATTPEEQHLVTSQLRKAVSKFKRAQAAKSEMYSNLPASQGLLTLENKVKTLDQAIRHKAGPDHAKVEARANAGVFQQERHNATLADTANLMLTYFIEMCELAHRLAEVQGSAREDELRVALHEREVSYQVAAGATGGPSLDLLLQSIEQNVEYLRHQKQRIPKSVASLLEIPASTPISQLGVLHEESLAKLSQRQRVIYTRARAAWH
ncbi:hypothetical protein JCM11641_004146 [Rhodosporidiobolus odoratus]